MIINFEKIKDKSIAISDLEDGDLFVLTDPSLGTGNFVHMKITSGFLPETANEGTVTFAVSLVGGFLQKFNTECRVRKVSGSLTIHA